MPGIIEIYTAFVKDSVQFHQERGKVERISRAKLELQVLSEIDEADIPISIKLSWYHTVLASSNFDAYWNSVAKRHNLPESCTTRYIIDHSLLDYEVPHGCEVDGSFEEKYDYEVDDGVEEALRMQIPNKSHNDTYNDTYTTDTAVEGISATFAPTSPLPTTNNETRQSSPDLSESESDTMSSSEYERLLDPLAHAPIKRAIPYCDRCKSTGHSTVACRVNFDPWTLDDWESDVSDEYPGGPECKKENRRLFLTGLLAGPRGDRAELDRIEDWLKGSNLTRQVFYDVIEAHKNGDDVREKLSPRSENQHQSKEKSINISSYGTQESGAISHAALDDVSSIACEIKDEEYEEPPSEIKETGEDKKETVNKLSQHRSYNTSEENHTASVDPSYQAREDDKGTCQNSPSKRKVKAGTKKLSSAKSASKPKGILKKKNASPRKKKQAFVRFSIDPAKFREWVQAQPKQEPTPIITESSIPAQALDTVDKPTAQAETGTISQGMKRKLEEFSDSEDEPLAVKKLKTSAAAAVAAASMNEGRRMASPKKKNSKIDQKHDKVVEQRGGTPKRLSSV